MNQPVDQETDSSLRLDNQLCFSIYSASRAIIRAYRPILERYDLTYPQYLVLLALWEKDDLQVCEIGRRLYLDSGTLTPLLKRMEASGYLERQRSVLDERQVVVHLTEKGLAFRQVALEIPQELVKGSHLDLGEARRTKVMVDQILQKFLESSSDDLASSC
jgi:DNA-binding MarR family transcriptional regulator